MPSPTAYRPTVRDLLTRVALAIATATTQLSACPDSVNLLGTEGLTIIAVRLGTLAQGRISSYAQHEGSSGGEATGSLSPLPHHPARRLQPTRMYRYAAIQDVFARGGPLSDYIPPSTVDAASSSEQQQPIVRATLAQAAVLAVYNVISNPNAAAVSYLQAIAMREAAVSVAVQRRSSRVGRDGLMDMGGASPLASPTGSEQAGGSLSASLQAVSPHDIGPAGLLQHLVASVQSVAGLLPPMLGRQPQAHTARGAPLGEAALASARQQVLLHQQIVAALVSVAATVAAPVDSGSAAAHAATVTARTLHTPGLLIPFFTVTDAAAGCSTASDEGVAVFIANLAAAAPSRYLPPTVINALVQLLLRSQEGGASMPVGSHASRPLTSLHSRLHLSGLPSSGLLSGRGGGRGIPLATVYAESARMVGVQVRSAVSV